MKKSLSLAIVFMFVILGNGCKKDSSTPGSGTTVTDPIVGSWRVSSFVKDSSDLTSQFSGYTFNCSSNGVMTIQGNGHTYNCTWSWHDSNHSMCNFHIMGCDSSSVLWECDDDWDLTSHDSHNCHFSDHNPNHHNTMAWIKI